VSPGVPSLLQGSWAVGHDMIGSVLLGLPLLEPDKSRVHFLSFILHVHTTDNLHVVPCPI